VAQRIQRQADLVSRERVIAEAARGFVACQARIGAAGFVPGEITFAERRTRAGAQSSVPRCGEGLTPETATRARAELLIFRSGLRIR